MLALIGIFLALFAGVASGATARADQNGVFDQSAVSSISDPVDKGLDVCPICHGRICLSQKDELDPSSQPFTPPFSGPGLAPLRLILRLPGTDDSRLLGSAQHAAFSPRGPPPIG